MKRIWGWWFGERESWEELEEIRLLVKGGGKCGIGDFYRMEKISNNRREKMG